MWTLSIRDGVVKLAYAVTPAKPFPDSDRGAGVQKYLETLDERQGCACRFENIALHVPLQFIPYSILGGNDEKAEKGDFQRT